MSEDGARTIEVGTLYRTLELDRAKMDTEKRTVDMSFSSEVPVERYFGMEVLDHDEKSIDMSRMEIGAPLLMEHDRADQIGVIEKAWIEKRRGMATVRFGNGARAKEIFQDVADGIRRLVSVGYRVHKLVTEKVENEVETLRAVRWTPYEISIVSVPADPTVGIGRSDSSTDKTNPVVIIPLSVDRRQPEATKKKSKMEAAIDTPPATKPDKLEAELERQDRIDIKEAVNKAREQQNKEMEEALRIANRCRAKYPGVDEDVSAMVRGEITLADLRERVFLKISQTNDQESSKGNDLSRLGPIGMSSKDLSKWSWRKAIMQAHDPRSTGFEREVSQEAVSKYKLDQRAPHSIIVPLDVLNYSQRGQLAGTGTLGGNVVETSLLAGSFIDILRNRMLVARAGATYLPGLVGNVTIPRQTGAAATTWATSEAAATNEASVTFDQVTLTPKQISARVDYTWLLLQQSTPAVDSLIRNDFLNVIARAIDLAALHGSGSSGQPTGIASTSGIGSVTGGTNGAAPTWGNIVSLETEVAIDNADIGTLAYITNAKVRGKLKQTLKGGTAATDGIYIWPEGPINDGFAMLNGYRIGTTNQVSSALTKGTSTTIASAIFFGNWADLLIGLWSGLELLTNPYSQAGSRVIESYAFQAVDIGVRHAQSFAAMLDALTT